MYIWKYIYIYICVFNSCACKNVVQACDLFEAFENKEECDELEIAVVGAFVY